LRQVRRRQLLIAAIGLVTPSLSAHAQTERRVRKIGYLSQASARVNAARLAAFRAGMLELRWVEGRDYSIDARYANGITHALPGLAAELVATRPDLLLVAADENVRLLEKSTKTIPIVFAITEDPVGTGIAASLRRPGGNATGLTTLSAELSAKRLQLLKEAFPHVANIVLLFEPDNVGSVSQAKQIREVASRLDLRITPIELRQPADIEPAFKRAIAIGAQAYIVTTGGTIASHRREIADRINSLKTPAMFPHSQYAEAGGLMSYGPSFTDNFRRAAAYVDKILNGANPGDIPIEQPTKFELIVNMKTAKATGFTFPESFLAQANRVIE
jgi:putative tryptophan/tyrosine transport system substrate-binding protein